MKFLKYTFLILLIIVATLLVIGFLNKGSYNYTKSMEIKATKAKVWSLINNFKSQDLWNPWNKFDTACKKQFPATDGVVGAVYNWDGNNKIGTGFQTITYIAENDSISLNLNITKPMPGKANVGYKITGTDGKLIVTENMYGTDGLIEAIFSTIFGTKSLMDKMFTSGLTILKNLAENTQNTEVKYEVLNVDFPTTILAVTNTPNKLFSSITGDFYTTQYAKVAEYIQNNKLSSTNAAYAVYKNVNDAMLIGDIYVGMDVNKNAPQNNQLSTITIAGKALKVSYFGEYKGSEAAYNAIIAYAEKNKLTLNYAIEHYVTDPSTTNGDWSKVQTDIYMILN